MPEYYQDVAVSMLNDKWKDYMNGVKKKGPKKKRQKNITSETTLRVQLQLVTV